MSGSSPSGPPHLLHIGYPDAGGAALQDWFTRHPQIAFRRGRLGGLIEVPALLDAIRGNAVDTGLPKVSSHHFLIAPYFGQTRWNSSMAWRRAPNPRHRYEIAQVLHALFPHAHVLIITRGFAAMVRHLYDEAVRGGCTRAPDEFARVLGELQRRGRGLLDYDAAVADYRAIFGLDRVTILPFELLVAQPLVAIGEIERILRLPAGSGPPFALQGDRVTLPADQNLWTRRLSHTIKHLPVPRWLRGLLLDGHVRLARSRRLPQPARILAAITPSRTSIDLTDTDLAAFRGCASTLRSLPHYSTYARDYLQDD